MLKLLLIDPEADLLIPISSNKIKYSFYSHISNEKKNILELQEKVKNYKSIIFFNWHFLQLGKVEFWKLYVIFWITWSLSACYFIGGPYISKEINFNLSFNHTFFMKISKFHKVVRFQVCDPYFRSSFSLHLCAYKCNLPLQGRRRV